MSCIRLLISSALNTLKVGICTGERCEVWFGTNHCRTFCMTVYLQVYVSQVLSCLLK